MKNLLSLKGLTAVFADAVMIPYNMTKTVFNAGRVGLTNVAGSGTPAKMAGIGGGLMLAAAMQEVAIIQGIALSTMAGTVGGVLTYYGFSLYMAGLLSLNSSSEENPNITAARRGFWPNTMGVIEQGKPGPQPA